MERTLHIQNDLLELLKTDVMVVGQLPPPEILQIAVLSET